MRTAAMILVIVTLSACAMADRSGGASTEDVSASYICGTEKVAVTFQQSPYQASMRIAEGSLLRLPGQPSGSGFRYAVEGYELRGKGATATLSTPDNTDILCTSGTRP